MTASSVLEVVDLLESDDIDVWLDGGWGVDALLGQETRSHDDLDLVIELTHSERVVELLHGNGYELVDGAPPRSFVLVDSVGRQVDVHPVTFDSAGGGVYAMETAEWVYPAEGFRGSGTVAGRRVRCLTPEVQVLVHAGYELTEKDYLELHQLRELFGVELPPELLDEVRLAATAQRAPGRP